MTAFEKLFGVKESQIRQTCVLMPVIPEFFLNILNIDSFKTGKIYGVSDNGNFSVIKTGIGAALTADAVLYLGKTACRNIILYGACGLTKKTDELDVGSILTPKQCFSFESFSRMLNFQNNADIYYPDKTMLSAFQNANPGIKSVNCATVGSLKLEEEYSDIFCKNDIDSVEMECSAVFHASLYAKMRCIALFFATDIIKEKPFYDISLKDKTIIACSIRKSFEMLCKFAKKHPSF